MSELILLHNPRCSKSRAALALLEERNLTVSQRRYLDDPLSESELHEVLAKLHMSPRQLLRSGEDEYRSLGLADPQLQDAELVAAMAAHPRLIERPILIAGNRAVVGRPPERILELLA
jgi:arsenate reductase